MVTTNGTVMINGLVTTIGIVMIIGPVTINGTIGTESSTVDINGIENLLVLMVLNPTECVFNPIGGVYS